jgi:SAM-dependent methyltransferase
MLTGSRGYRRGIAHIVQQDQLGRHDHAGQHDTQPAWHYADNGFASARTMLELHQPIIELARSGLANDIGNVLDLGCGNGALLAKVCDGRNDLVPYGIDNNGVAVAHARLLLPRFAQNFVQGDLFDVTLWGEGSRRYTLALLMLGRLFEVPRDRALRMLDGLCGSCSRVLAYVYPDWNERTLQDAARQFGLDVEESGCATAAYLKTKGYGVGESAAIPRAGS